MTSRSRLVTSAATMAVVSAVVLGSGAAMTVASAAGSAAPHAALGGVPITRSTTTKADIGYAVNRSLCNTKVVPGHVNCFAMRRVAASKSTPGAHAYVRAFAPGTAAKLMRTAPDSTLKIGPGPVGGYTPDDLAALYDYKPTTSARSQIVGIVDWANDPHVKADLAHFDKTYKLHKETSSSFHVVNQNGRTSPLPSSSAGRDTAGEISLDVETVRGVCQTCRILLVEAKNSSNANIATAEETAVGLGATEVTNSFGGAEQGATAKEREAFNEPGVVITASTGDDGWYGWDLSNAKRGQSVGEAEFPATDPTVVSVGGTAIGINKTTGARNGEIAWNENGADDQVGLAHNEPQGAGGGGCSVEFKAPSWQSDYPGYAAAGCDGHRLAADVSADADPETGFDVYDTWGKGDHGWATAGGTSLSSPLVAAMWALAGGSGQAAYPAFSVYNNAAAHQAYDVTEGGNSFCGGDSTSTCSSYIESNFTGSHTNPNGLGRGFVDCSFTDNSTNPATSPAQSSECNATSGYDGPTGVGTPLSPKLFTSTSPTATLSPPGVVRARRPATFTAHSTEKLAGASINKVEFIWGDGHSTTGTSLTASHTFAKKGTFVVVLVVSDTRGQTSVNYRLIKIGTPLHLSLAGPRRAKVGHKVKFHARASDPNTGGKITTISWSWGDHGTSKGAKASHKWHRPGTYKIVVTVKDTTGVKTKFATHIKIT